MNKQENKNEGNNNKVKEVKLSYLDFICPICLEILIEPVQMPCQHELCMNCFQMHVYNTSLTCPMCRLRISTWARINTKNKTLVNVNRWKLIKESFPDRVKSRLENKEYVEEVVVAAPIHIIAQDGDIRKEYEEQRRQQMSTANTPMKTEPMEHPMFSPNMHVGNPFSFPPVGFPPMGNNNMQPATSPTGRGRGQGPGQLVKRKIDMPGSISPGHNFKMEQPNNIKQELPPGGGMPLNNFPINQQPPQQQQSSSPSLNWQDYMETLESYVNGQRAAVTYKCRLCGAAIAQRGNFPRHFKMHQKNS